LECKLHEIQTIGENRLIMGIVQRVQVHESIFDPATLRIRGECYHPVGRMGSPDWYCRTDGLFEMKRPD
jgi:flavin reductase (DIM6/NTAB) family NADH-FMN oxidoreductase RutF